MNTCAVRDNAESRVWTRLRQLKALKRDAGHALTTVGVLGCMAERLKAKLLETEDLADLVCGPDAYRDVPRLLENSTRRLSDLSEEHRMNVLLSLDETYADVRPVRRDVGSPMAYVSVMRGCDNMCAFCVVPFTRGRERSRPFESVVDEARGLIAAGVNPYEVWAKQEKEAAMVANVKKMEKTQKVREALLMDRLLQEEEYRRRMGEAEKKDRDYDMAFRRALGRNEREKKVSEYMRGRTTSGQVYPHHEPPCVLVLCPSCVLVGCR